MAELNKARMVELVRKYGAESRKLGATSFFKPEWSEAEQAAFEAFDAILQELFPLARANDNLAMSAMERASRELDEPHPFSAESWNDPDGL